MPYTEFDNETLIDCLLDMTDKSLSTNRNKNCTETGENLVRMEWILNELKDRFKIEGGD